MLNTPGRFDIENKIASQVIINLKVELDLTLVAIQKCPDDIQPLRNYRLSVESVSIWSNKMHLKAVNHQHMTNRELH